MGAEMTGRVAVAATITNWDDAKAVEDGHLAPGSTRRIEVGYALVDTGATYLSLPVAIIRRLGLRRTRTRNARTPTGPAEFGIYEPVLLTIQGRDCWPEVAEVADTCPVLIGQLPLESLDFLVDPANRRLVGNPEHGGEHMFELY